MWEEITRMSVANGRDWGGGWGQSQMVKIKFEINKKEKHSNPKAFPGFIEMSPKASWDVDDKNVLYHPIPKTIYCSFKWGQTTAEEFLFKWLRECLKFRECGNYFISIMFHENSSGEAWETKSEFWGAVICAAQRGPVQGGVCSSCVSNSEDMWL